MITAQQKFALPVPAFCVLADGPQETETGAPQWVVMFGDKDGEPIDFPRAAVWLVHSYHETKYFARYLAEKYRLELIDESERP